MYKHKDIPRIGFGTYKLKTQNEINHSLEHAFNAGYRMIDTAVLYKNEHLISNFLSNCKSIARSDIWITSKVPYFTMLDGDEQKIKNCIENSAKLFDGYIDLYLIHASNPNDVQTWQILRDYQTRGIIRYVGISNYNLERLDNFIERIGADEAKFIYMNQIEFNPFLNRDDLITRCQNLGIRITAYGSLYKYNNDILAIADKYKVAPENVLLAWGMSHGVSVIPMSRNQEHIRMNIESLKLELNDNEIKSINGLNENYTRFAKHL
jgi:diketogulonate reductase-like aldo/keto reductase